MWKEAAFFFLGFFFFFFLFTGKKRDFPGGKTGLYTPPKGLNLGGGVLGPRSWGLPPPGGKEGSPGEWVFPPLKVVRKRGLKRSGNQLGPLFARGRRKNGWGCS
ncbi:hypothetical protein CGSHi6P18H1_05070 [Haemophilus influenzae 6P18H1]|nr:hypothetical protein CGSHi6P18H1_05070 [Haemophilus influenzae 6P18H1]